MRQALVNPREETSEKIFSLLFSEDELTWQNIIYDMIDSNEIDPWDVDIGLLARKFIQRVRMLKEMDFRISGKVILAAAILLKIKSNKLVDEDIAALDFIINSQEAPGDFLEELGDVEADLGKDGRIRIFPRTPQPRKRKVSVYDLVRALEQALDVESRRKRWIITAPIVEAPKKPRDINLVIADVYNKIIYHFKDETASTLTFSNLIPSDSKEDKVLTFIPLLHLETQRKVDMDQKEHFGEIFISLCKKAS
jgi:segregation and condensation protein A